MKIPVNEEAWKSRKEIRMFTLADDASPPVYVFVLKGRSETISTVLVDGGENIEIYPERSASHRVLKDVIST